MGMEKKKTKYKKVLMIFFSIVMCIIMFLCIIFINEIQTILSIHKLNDKPAYQMTYHGDYALDKYLKEGSEDWNELLNFINENLGKGIGKYIYGQYGCSAFTAKTPEGDYILGRNLDTEVAIPAVIKTNTKKGYKTLGVTNLSIGGWTEHDAVTKLTAISSPYFTFDGINEYGVAACSLSVPIGLIENVDKSKVTIHDLTVVRVLIDKAKNVKEAIELLSRHNIKMEKTYPTHYMIADSEGNSVIVEYINGEMKVVERKEAYQIATNFILYENEKLIGYSSDRYKAFEKVLSQTNGILTEEEALNLLIENTVPGEEQWSVVYNLTNKSIMIKFYGDYENTYTYRID